MIVMRGNRPMSLPSKQYQDWHEEQSWFLKSLSHLNIEHCTITQTFFAPDKRATDLSNKAESINDLLVDNGVLKDDNWFVISSLHLEFGGVDKENPRVEIIINH